MQKKKIPTGIASYEKMKSQNYYTVDKTMMIKDYLERGSEVTLITRPRRFGKTMNMSMLSEFFDITKNSKNIFKDTKIMNTEYASEMNQYPTIFISFLNAKGDLNNVIKFVKQELLREFDRYSFIVDGLRDRLQRKYNKFLDELEDDTTSLRNVNDSISFLTLCLEAYYGKKVMVFIDEYDTPFIEAHVNDFYKELHVDLASLLRTALKGNDALQYAMLTGIQRVAKENIFSDLNNLDVYTMKDITYAQYFGFTKEETKELLEYYNLEYNDQVKEMYDGYTVGNVDIYNPWSIINYAKNRKLEAYWVNTSSNNMIKNAMKDSEPSFHTDFENLILNGYLETEINMETSFYEQSNTSSLWGLFVNAGYLTISDRVATQEDELISNVYRIRIPNKEVVSEFNALVAYYLHVDTKDLSDLYKSIRTKDEKLFYTTYGRILLVNPSFYDLISENSYQMLLLGICLYAKHEYELLSNREEGKGRCEVLPCGYIILKAKKQALPSYVIELKYMKKEEYEKNQEALKSLAQEAIKQINNQKYDVELTGDIIHIGLAHSGKDVEMVWKQAQ